MKSVKSFIKTTLIGGFLFIVPVALLIMLIIKIVDLMRTLVGPLVAKFSYELISNITMARVISFILLILLCFIAGLLAKTDKAKQLQRYIENNILSLIPGYSFFKGLGEEAVGIDSANIRKVVLVDIEEVWQIGFLMDQIDDELFTVFIPGAPNPTSGDVFFVKEERIKILEISEIEAMKIYKKMGIDAKVMLSDTVSKQSF